MNEEQDNKVVEALLKLREAEMEMDLALQDMRKSIAEAIEKLEALRE